MIKRSPILAILFLSLLSISVSAQVDESYFDYMDLFDLQMVSSPEISPDGNTIIYERHQFNVMTDRRFVNLWSISFSGNNHRPLTSGTDYYGNVSWSPSGDRITYTSSNEGSNQIFVRWMSSGETASITNLTESPGNLSWSPDGSKILFSKFVPGSSSPRIADLPSPPAGAKWEQSAKVIDKAVYRRDGGGYVDEGYTHLYVIPSEGGAPRKLTSGDYDHGSPSWAPDGKHIIYTADKSEDADMDPNNEQIYLLNIETGEETQITDKRGPHNNPKISPDGKLIAYTGYEDQFLGYQQSELYIMNMNGSNLRNISEDFDQDISSITWANDSKSLFFRYDEEGNSKVGNIKLNGDVTSIAQNLGSPSSGRPYGGGSYSVAKNGRFAFSEVSTSHPTELAAGHFPTKMANKTLTNLNGEFFKSTKVGNVEEFWVESSVDDFRVQGWIITPPDFDPNKKYPLILEIHGGPYTNYGSRFTPELQFMASRGYVVVYTNPRGSTSYGAEFASYINHNYPSEDHNDLMDAVDYVVDQGYIDEDNLFITGGSGGGVLSSWAIGKTDRFKAAVVAKPVINWYSFVLTADGSPFYSKYWFTKKPWEDPEQYLERSPISLVGNVTTPTMLLTGEQDYRTPMSETEQYYAALKLQGVDAAMVRIQGSGHGIAAKPSNLFRKVAYIIGWFDKYKK
ncbi:S9 family peptidase [Gracilimonas sp.]|uniref:S9 family peptidase n=1 Tax=Gracilimonas sp. TaxID=1974203 RepID=UPI0032EEFEA1